LDALDAFDGVIGSMENNSSMDNNSDEEEVLEVRKAAEGRATPNLTNT
jgi:hypothetical protein